jgi:hypothetical protein
LIARASRKLGDEAVEGFGTEALPERFHVRAHHDTGDFGGFARHGADGSTIR